LELVTHFGLPFFNLGIKGQIIILNQKKTTMKKFLAIATIAAILVSCNGDKSAEATNTTTDSAAVTVDTAAKAVTVDTTVKAK